jgi:branched-chain amino acid transport system permease protein
MTENAAANSASVGRMARPARRPVAAIPVLELLLLAVFAVLPALLPDYLTVFATRVLILSLLALSFDLVWGYAGILSFGQALFYGSAGYVVALIARDLDITSIFIVLPAALLVGLGLAFLMACFLLLAASRRPSCSSRSAR